MMGVMLVTLFLVGCGAPAATLELPTPTLTPIPPTPTPIPPTPTSTSTPTPTPPTPTPIPPTPTRPSGPKAGHWEGKTIPYDSNLESSTISFDVTDDSNISDFKIDFPFMTMGQCTITLKEIALEADGTFALEDEYKGEWNGEDKTFTQKITGMSDSTTTMTGTYGTQFCGPDADGRYGLSIFGSGGTWKAEWKGP